MYNGLNTMGSYASQTSIKERWQIDHYVMQLKGALEGKPEREFTTENLHDTITGSEMKVEGKQDLVPAINAGPSSIVQE
jgi:hypothetical protein